MQIVRRTRLGNDTEDITLFSTARTSSPGLAVIDGYDVLNVPTSPPLNPGPILQAQQPALGSTTPTATAPALSAPINRPAPKLFDVLGLGLGGSPRGIGYIDSRQQFVFNDPFALSTLFFTDSRGLPISSIDIQYPNGQPVLVEGLSYIPTTSRVFPDTLLMIASFEDDTSDSGLQSRVEVVNLDGTVAREVVPPTNIASLLLTGVSFKSQGKLPGNLLLSSDDDQTIYEIDFKGNLIATYQDLNSSRRQMLHGIEGLAQLSNGQVIAAGNFDGLIAVTDLNGTTPPTFVDYRVGIGLSLTSGIAWDSTANQFLVIGFDRQRPDSPTISSVPSALNSFQPIVQVDPTTRRLTYIPAEGLIAAAHPNNPRGILLFKGPKPAGQIDTSQLGGAPRAISFIPTTNEFILVFNNQKSKLSILTREGALSRTIDLAPAGVASIAAVTYFNPNDPSGGQFLVFDNSLNLVVVTDFNGRKIREFDRAAFNVLNPSSVTSITTGPDAGAFALVNSENSELIVFRLD
jgi:hypothetical protein